MGLDKADAIAVVEVAFEGVIHVAEAGEVGLHEKNSYSNKRGEDGNQAEQEQGKGEEQFPDDVSQGNAEAADEVSYEAGHVPAFGAALSGKVSLYFFRERTHKGACQDHDEVFVQNKTQSCYQQAAEDGCYFTDQSGAPTPGIVGDDPGSGISAEAPGSPGDAQPEKETDECRGEVVGP